MRCSTNDHIDQKETTICKLCNEIFVVTNLLFAYRFSFQHSFVAICWAIELFVLPLLHCCYIYRSKIHFAFESLSVRSIVKRRNSYSVAPNTEYWSASPKRMLFRNTIFGSVCYVSLHFCFLFVFVVDLHVPTIDSFTLMPVVMRDFQQKGKEDRKHKVFFSSFFIFFFLFVFFFFSFWLVFLLRFHRKI